MRLYSQALITTSGGKCPSTYGSQRNICFD
jgi:hypothetical protein